LLDLDMSKPRQMEYKKLTPQVSFA
jgi:hypothetical protein